MIEGLLDKISINPIEFGKRLTEYYERFNEEKEMIIQWPSIEAFANVRKNTHQYPELCDGDMCVQYRAKVKLHGTNAGIQCHEDGRVVAQSRTAELSVGNDNAGFARWVEETKQHWSNKSGLVFFGEWCGPGIQKGVAVNQIPNKSFVVFAARSLSDPEMLYVAPSELQILVSGIPNVYVLPWAEPTITVDWSKSAEELVPLTEFINRYVMAVEECDPWVEATFGVKGTGEGLVFYPISHLNAYSVKNFSNLCFKAKGEKHRVVKSAGAATVNPEVAANVDQFVELVLTEARLEQGATTVNASNQNANPVEFDKRLTGAFVAWVKADVAKETKDELEASGLTFSQIEKVLTNKARTWYINKSG